MTNGIKQTREKILSEAHAGFRPGRSTIDQLFTLRRQAEKFCEFSRHLIVCYVDFKKALDGVWRIELWKVLRFLGYEDKTVRLLEALYEGTRSTVRVGGHLAEWFLASVYV